MHEPAGSSWDTSVRVTKTSEDRYVRSNSSSSQSSMDEPIRSPRSNVFSLNTNPQQMIKPDFNRVFILPFSNFLYSYINFHLASVSSSKSSIIG
jgi:hypothetical protein